MSNARSFLLGAFFIAALCILGYYTLFLTNINWFKHTYEMKVDFADLHGLREGDAVLVAGMRWGRVEDMEFHPNAELDRRITVTAVLEKPLQLRKDSKIVIEDATLLGGRNLSIDPGPAGAEPLPPGTRLSGSVAPSALEALSKLVNESQKGVQEVVANLAEVTRRARDGRGPFGRLLNDEEMGNDLAEAVDRLSKTLASTQSVMADLANGRGTAGQLLTNGEVYQNLADATRSIDAAVGRMSGILDDVQSGKGTLGRLIEDQALANDFAAGVHDLRLVIEKVQKGEGTLGALVNDDTLAQNLTAITSQVRSGEGTIGALLMKNDVYDDIHETTQNLAVTTTAIRNGEGSLGRLINDDELYQQIKTAVAIVQRALEEYREAAPITTFTSVFFGAF